MLVLGMGVIGKIGLWIEKLPIHFLVVVVRREDLARPENNLDTAAAGHWQ